MEKERHILVVFPHPDDEAFGVSGTIASYINTGSPLTYACLTLGQMGRNMGNPPFANRETLPEIRKVELKEAARVLGISDLRMLGFRDKTIEFEDEDMLTNLISSLITELNPSLIISFYPGYSVHPDHEATGAAVVRAVEKMPPEDRPKLHLVAFSRNCVEELGEPDIINDISSLLDIKLESIKAHRSQTELMVAEMAEKLKKKDPNTIAWLKNERFWVYKFS